MPSCQCRLTVQCVQYVISASYCVFGDNAVAMDLYRKVGYRTVATTMRKGI